MGRFFYNRCNFCSREAAWYCVRSGKANDKQVFFCENHEGGWMAELKWWPANELPQKRLV